MDAIGNVIIAMQQLRAGTCDAALVGAVDGTNNPFGFMAFSKTHALSPQGTSRPFDEEADGIVVGEGVAAIVLKRLADAERDGDPMLVKLPRTPGRKDSEYMHLFSGEVDIEARADRTAPSKAHSDRVTVAELADRVSALEAEVARLRSKLD